MNVKQGRHQTMNFQFAPSLKNNEDKALLAETFI